MSNWTIYILRCADNSLYTGITTDLEARLVKHNAGTASKYTRAHLPVEVVWTERAATESDAKKREAEIKKLTKEDKEKIIKINHENC